VNGGKNLSSEINLIGIKTRVRVQSMLPITATNYHKYRKGLYLNPLKGHPYDF
jgi:hypothetical protein